MTTDMSISKIENGYIVEYEGEHQSVVTFVFGDLPSALFFISNTIDKLSMKAGVSFQAH